VNEKNSCFVTCLLYTYKKTAQRGWVRWECLQYASTSWAAIKRETVFGLINTSRSTKRNTSRSTKWKDMLEIWREAM